MFRLIKNIVLCFYRAAADFIKHDGVEHAGYLSFLAILSLFPFLVFLVSIFGAFGKAESAYEIVEFVFGSVPPQFTSALQDRVHEIVLGPPQGLLTLAIVGAVWTASSSVEGIRTTLNRAYRVESPPHYLFRRLFSILEFFVITVALFLAMSAYALIPIIWNDLGQLLHVKVLSLTIQSTSNLLAGAILLVGILAIHYMIPNCRQRVFSIVPGAILTVIGWLAATKLLVFYISSFQQLNIIYGSLGSLIISLLFFYLLNIIFIYGAEFNYHVQKLYIWPKKTSKRKQPYL